MSKDNPAQRALHHHVTGAVERGEAEPITAIEAPRIELELIPGYAAFIDGYVACALWSSTDGDETPLDENHEPRDIDASTMQDMVSDCIAFVQANGTELERFGILTGRDAGALGHDLWLTRNHHGAGYWDRYMEASTPVARAEAREIGQRLTAAAEAIGETDLIL